MVILFVCTGNTCRSPMAEHYLRRRIEERGMANVSVTSAGMRVETGSRMSELAVKVLESSGIVTEQVVGDAQCAVQMDVNIIHHASMIVCVTQNHAQILKELFPRYSYKIFAMPNEIPDPYGKTESAYRKCFGRIKLGIDKMINADFFEILPDDEGVSVVPFVENKLDDLCEIEEKSFDSPWNRNMFAEIVENPLSVNFAAVKDGRTIGYLLSYGVAGELQILNLAVSEEHRRSGIAIKMLSRAKKYCKMMGLSKITLEVRSKNTAAASLYIKMGFKQVGMRKKYYQDPIDDAVLMDYNIEA